ncbi:hypothetical protein E2542_SST15096 [Spatholobus suberectus]|nr:hypothetical protein E2542_SST15096 [Spatholobus suberectus]
MSAPFFPQNNHTLFFYLVIPLQFSFSFLCFLCSVKLRCRGVNPNDHPVKSELDKINVLQKKLERLPRLSEVQRQDMKNISGGEGPETNYQERAGQKRKYPSSEEQSVQIDAMESLENEKGEHLDDNNGNIKGAIVIDISDDDDELLAP